MQLKRDSLTTIASIESASRFSARVTMQQRWQFLLNEAEELARTHHDQCCMDGVDDTSGFVDADGYRSYMERAERRFRELLVDGVQSQPSR